MIQILLETSPGYNSVEMARKAIDAGCEWLIVPRDAHDNDVANLAKLCREEGIILTIEDNIELCRQHELHGVHLSGGSNPAAVRQELGAEAIVGAEISSIDTATALAKADIDYFALQPCDVAVATQALQAGVEAHFVLLADGVEQALSLLPQGFSGMCLKASSFTSEDPSAEIKLLIDNI